MVKKGRVPGRPLTGLELRHLRLLLEIRERAKNSSTVYDQRLEDFILALLHDDASTQGIASAIGVGKTTVQNWKAAAERRRS